jgi:hypothetical protein
MILLGGAGAAILTGLAVFPSGLPGSAEADEGVMPYPIEHLLLLLLLLLQVAMLRLVS